MTTERRISLQSEERSDLCVWENEGGAAAQSAAPRTLHKATMGAVHRLFVGTSVADARLSVSASQKGDGCVAIVVVRARAPRRPPLRQAFSTPLNRT